LLRDWWRSLERAPEPLSSDQRVVVLAAAAVAAVTRLLAVARTAWDWDELLFMHALRHFDVAQHHPQPPGFPLYVLAAKAVAVLGVSEFHALQAVSLTGALLIVPSMFFLCRELRLAFSTALCASLLLAFLPNVWFYGGAAFSDVPSMTLAVVSMALLLAGCRDGGAYLAGAVLLGVTAGFRPQALLIGMAPMAAASWWQFRRGAARVVIAVASIVGITALSYGAAAWLTGWNEYRRALALHGEYITRVDSFRSPIRPPLWRVFDDFFVTPFHAAAIDGVLVLLTLVSAGLSLVRRRGPVLLALAAFGPFCLFAWLMLDRFSAARFAIAWAPLTAILAADGIARIARRPRFELVLCGVLVVSMVLWTWPALRQLDGSAPTIAAPEWIRAHVSRAAATIYVHTDMRPFAEWELSGYRLRFGDSPPPARWTAARPAFILAGVASAAPGARNFVRARGRLWDIVRRRYFEVSVRPVTRAVVFGDGWYAEERAGDEVWRWMGARSWMTLPPPGRRAHLALSFYVPLDALPSAPDVTISLDGERIDEFRATSSTVRRDLTVAVHGEGSHELAIETDRVATPLHDPRALGLRLNSIEWAPLTPP